MSSELFLIAHKVRGEAAFDIAIKMSCPECSAMGCLECDDTGSWWIIPTSGHRAYPWNSWALEELFWAPTESDSKIPITDATEAIMAKDFSSLPDHYPTSAAPKVSLLEALNLAKPKPHPPIVRRI